ncbi:M23 family metallopeptidase [Paenibacillus thiaminolyticus]|nr:M23 family metallopeptidase [Paenibacillus thiaminolyticus]
MKRLVTMLSVVALCIASLSTIASANSKYTWPVPDSTRITQGFNSSTHKGIDIGAKTAGVAGNRIVAYYDGTVSRSGWSDSYGWVVYVHHVINSANYQSRYAHMNKTPAVSTNQKVGKGAISGIWARREMRRESIFISRQENARAPAKQTTPPIRSTQHEFLS